MLEYRKNHLQPNDANEAKNNNRKICFCHYVGSTDPQYNHLFMFWFDINSNLSGGFGTYLFALSENIAKQATEANDAMNIKNPHLGWIIGFLFLVSFVGLFALVPMRKVETSLPQYFLHIYSIFKNTSAVANWNTWLQTMIVDYKLTYPSGTATAYLINGFHTPQGAELAKWVTCLSIHLAVVSIICTSHKKYWLTECLAYFRKQVRTLGKYFSMSFVWAFFQWFYTAGNDCGFSSFPSLGLEAYKNRLASSLVSASATIVMNHTYILMPRPGCENCI